MSTTYDNRQHAKRLVDAGMSPELADVQAAITGELMNELTTLQTRLDTFTAKTESRFQRTDDEIELVEARMETMIADAEVQLIR
jgi:capsule polysaccharide export protein KpsE/RkpR